MNKGKYIVIEGSKGVGKTTIIQLLAHQLQKDHLPVKIMREPDSQNDLTARALRRLIKDPLYPMNTRTEVLLYNAARAQSLEVIRNAIDNGVTCLVDRSYLSTLAVQYYGQGDEPDYDRINEVIEFAVGDMEPDLMVVLDAPVTLLLDRIKSNYSDKIIGDIDEAFMERVRAGYLWEAKQRSLPVIYASENTDNVFNQVWKLVTEILSERERDQPIGPKSVADVLAARTPSRGFPVETPITTTLASTEPDDRFDFPTQESLLDKVAKTDDEPLPPHLTPKRLSKQVAQEFNQSISQILDIRSKLIDKLKAAHLSSDEPARLTLPLAIIFKLADSSKLSSLLNNSTNQLADIARENIKMSYQSSERGTQLVSYWPRNELKLTADILYPYTNLSLEELSKQTDDWAYAQKSSILSSAIPKDSSALSAVNYTFDMIASYNEMLYLSENNILSMHQLLTPRYGYHVPDNVESAGLSDLFEQCFDISLSLHSHLQAAGYAAEAQLATLLGHQQRIKFTINAYQLVTLQAKPPKALLSLLPSLYESISTVHPLIAAAIQPQRAKTV